MFGSRVYRADVRVRGLNARVCRVLRFRNFRV